ACGRVPWRVSDVGVPESVDAGARRSHAHRVGVPRIHAPRHPRFHRHRSPTLSLTTLDRFRGKWIAVLPDRFSAALFQLELLIDDVLEDLEWLATTNHPPVDEEGRRAVHADLVSRLLVGFDLRPVLVGINTGIELRRIEP